MDYKKLYEKAVERAKTLTNSGFNDFDFVKHIFPELAESEDEKIRKGIIRNLEYLMDRAEGFVKDELKEKIAWLEKQGDANKEYWRGYREGKQEILDKYAELEKQGEQKSAEFKPSFRVGDVIKPKDPVLGEPRIIKGIHPKFGYDTNNGILDFEFEDNWELVEQKPANKVEPKFKVKYAGSEYNVFEIKDIAGVIFYGIEDEPNHIDYVKADNCEIISGYDIKEIGLSFPTKPVMFSEQKPAWSEEDEKMLNDILMCGERHCYLDAGNIAWLKSLRPQNTWKPSGFHLECISDAIAMYQERGINAIGLKEILEELKKLKEE